MSSQPALPIVRAISAETMKMPDPIIDPMTTMVESYSPSPRLNSVSSAVAATEVDCIILAPAVPVTGAAMMPEIAMNHTRDDAWRLLTEYTKSDSLLKHAM